MSARTIARPAQCACRSSANGLQGPKPGSNGRALRRAVEAGAGSKTLVPCIPGSFIQDCTASAADPPSVRPRALFFSPRIYFTKHWQSCTHPGPPRNALNIRNSKPDWSGDAVIDTAHVARASVPCAGTVWPVRQVHAVNRNRFSIQTLSIGSKLCGVCQHRLHRIVPADGVEC